MLEKETWKGNEGYLLFVVKERRVQECKRLRDGPILKREKSVGR
jgi:hypothetical protein